MKAGDTLGGIAANYAVKGEAIQAYNGRSNDIVFEGENLIIPLCEQQLETPSPTPVPPYAASNLLLPADGASFASPSDVITLQWSSVGALRDNEAYAVTVEDVTEGNARKLWSIHDGYEVHCARILPASQQFRARFPLVSHASTPNRNR